MLEDLRMQGCSFAWILTSVNVINGCVQIIIHKWKESTIISWNTTNLCDLKGFYIGIVLLKIPGVKWLYVFIFPSSMIILKYIFYYHDIVGTICGIFH